MKVLYILSGTGLHGGATKSFLAMADAVAAAGHEIGVVTPDENGVTQIIRQKGWKSFVTPYRFWATPPIIFSVRNILLFLPRIARTVATNMRARKNILKFATEFNPDLIHDNTTVTESGYLAARALSVPHVIHAREYGWKDFRLILPGLKKRLTAPDTWLVSITKDIAGLRGKSMRPDHVRVIYNGIVDTDDITYDADKEGYFLYGGRIDVAKGVQDLIDAYIMYARKSLDEKKIPMRLKLAGSSRFREDFQQSLKEKIQQAGVETFIDWLGEVSNFTEFAQKAAATVIPSLFEGFGRVMPEAMCAGSLCIARPTGGTLEQLDNGMDTVGKPIAMTFSTVNDLSDRFDEIDRAWRSGKGYKPGERFYEMIADARQTVKTLYSKQKYGEKILDYYNYIIQNNIASKNA